MTSNPDVQKITFTGSTEVGRLLMRQSASTIKKLSLELGAMPRLLFSTMRTSTPRWKERSSPNTVTPARPASARTASTFRTVSTRSSPKTRRRGGETQGRQRI